MASGDRYAKLRDIGVRDIISLDTEFRTKIGARVEPVCMCARSILTDEVWKQWYEPGTSLSLPVDLHTLFVCFSAPAEWGYFEAAGWKLPVTIVDLFAEMMLRTNGCKGSTGKRIYPGLLSSLESYGIGVRMVDEKKDMRDLVLRGAPYSPTEKASILSYCLEDVDDTVKLFDAMLPHLSLDWPTGICRAMARGSFTRVVARTEFAGIPVDVESVNRLKQDWPVVMVKLATALEHDHKYGVYTIEEGNVKWSTAGFEKMVHRMGLSAVWPKTKSERFMTSDVEGREGKDVFKRMAELCPELEDLRQTRKTFSEMKKFDLPIGSDGRCRTYPWPWHTTTGRNQPRRGFLFALQKWARFLIAPPPGRSLAYIDLVSAEFGIAAALSQDKNMMATYNSGGDIYVSIARLAGAVPAGATKKSHPRERKLYKVAMLAAQYGMKMWGLAKSLGISEFEAGELLRDLHRMYATYFTWIDWAVIQAQINHKMIAPMGWELSVDEETNHGSLLNFPMQTGCGEILRVATCLMLDNGIQIDAMIHDATLTEAPSADIERNCKIVGECWTLASKKVLRGFELRSDCSVTTYPNRFNDPDGAAMWERLQAMIAA
jgi:DNA polymerase-1